MGQPLILFGAGASFGSDTQGTPPLGGSLFDTLAEFSPQTWGGIQVGEAELFRDNFEQGMRAFADVHPCDVDRLQRAMAGYFFTFQPTRFSLYVRLGERIRASNWNGTLASLNYERLLDLALRSGGLECRIQAVRKGNTDIELVLPHGCCHLFGKIRTPVPTPNLGCPGVPITGAGTQPPVRVVSPVPTILKAGKRADGTEPTTNLVGPGRSPVDFGHDVRLDSDTVRIIEAPDEHAEELRKSTVPPVMCYFQPDKDTRAGVSFVRDQRECFKKLVGAASTVAIIGVMVRKHDTHIWGPLRETGAKIIYCSGEKAGAKFRCWARAAGRKGDEVLPVFWDDGFRAICSGLGIG